MPEQLRHRATREDRDRRDPQLRRVREHLLEQRLAQEQTGALLVQTLQSVVATVRDM